MLTYNEALEKLKQTNLENHLLKHALQSAAIMRAVAKHLAQDEELWAITGLMHDYDYPQTAHEPNQHGLLTAQLLADDLNAEALYAIQAHNAEMTGVPPKSKLDYALRASESLSGLLNAASLMRPTGFEGMQVSSVKKKMKDKAFAANVNRDNIKESSYLELDLDTFLALAIEAVQ